LAVSGTVESKGGLLHGIGARKKLEDVSQEGMPAAMIAIAAGDGDNDFW